ncbi:MAG: hypothetical protein WC919_03425 [Candidatus Paceibacterota bacterium]|jgi:hypothetical protein
MIFLWVVAGIVPLAVLLVLKQARSQQHRNAQILEGYSEWLKAQPPPQQEPRWRPDPETIKKLRTKYRHIIDPDSKPELTPTPVDVERVINLD